MDRRQCRHDDRYDKMYDLIELIYILNRLSNNSYIDERSKKYLIGMLEDVESIKSNFDKYRGDEHCKINYTVGCNNYDDCNFNDYSDSFLDRILFYLKRLND